MDEEVQEQQQHPSAHPLTRKYGSNPEISDWMAPPKIKGDEEKSPQEFETYQEWVASIIAGRREWLRVDPRLPAPPRQLSPSEREPTSFLL